MVGWKEEGNELFKGVEHSESMNDVEKAPESEAVLKTQGQRRGMVVVLTCILQILYPPPYTILYPSRAQVTAPSGMQSALSNKGTCICTVCTHIL